MYNNDTLQVLGKKKMVNSSKPGSEINTNYSSKSKCSKGNVDKFYNKNNNFYVAKNPA